MRDDKASGDVMPPLRYELAAKAEQAARTGGAWSVRHIRVCWLVLAGFGVIFTAAGFLISGSRAGWGALVGTAIVGAFFTVSAVVIAWVGRHAPTKVMWAALSTYVLKMIGLGIVLALVPPDGVLDLKWMAAAVGLGIAVWLGGHMRYVWTNKIFYVDPA